MIIYSEQLEEPNNSSSSSGYKVAATSQSRSISDRSPAVKTSALSRENKEFLKQIGLKLKEKKRKKSHAQNKK